MNLVSIIEWPFEDIDWNHSWGIPTFIIISIIASRTLLVVSLSLGNPKLGWIIGNKIEGLGARVIWMAVKTIRVNWLNWIMTFVIKLNDRDDARRENSMATDFTRFLIPHQPPGISLVASCRNLLIFLLCDYSPWHTQAVCSMLFSNILNDPHATIDYSLPASSHLFGPIHSVTPWKGITFATIRIIQCWLGLSVWW